MNEYEHPFQVGLSLEKRNRQDGIKEVDPDIAGEIASHVARKLGLTLGHFVGVNFDIEDRLRLSVENLAKFPSSKEIDEIIAIVRGIASLDDGTPIIIKLKH